MTDGVTIRSAVRPFHRPATWTGIWIFGWLLCIVLSLVRPPDLGLDVPDSDKIGHLLAYGLLSGWATMLFATTRARIAAALALVLLGVAMELAQGALTSYRMMDARDALANTVGVGLGQLLVFTPASKWLLRLDAKLFG